jgi:hypothetical protein
MKTLTLDLGTHTGWSLMEGGAIIQSGTYDLATPEEIEEQRHAGKERLLDVRFVRLLEFTRQKVQEGVTRIVFEDVLFHGAGRAQTTQLWASLRTAIWVVAYESPSVAAFGVPVATLKSFALGKGLATKEEMAQSLANAEPGCYQLNEKRLIVQAGKDRAMDDNEVDAVWLARFTASVDRGERDFLAVYERKQKAKARRKARRAERRAAKRLREREEKEKQKRRALAQAAKATGTCCGVFRKPAPRGRVVCPKCGESVRIPKPQPANMPPESVKLPPADKPLADITIQASDADKAA